MGDPEKNPIDLSEGNIIDIDGFREEGEVGECGTEKHTYHTRLSVAKIIPMGEYRSVADDELHANDLGFGWRGWSWIDGMEMMREVE